MNEDWELRLSFFPPDGEALAADHLVRVLLHLGGGGSLRETAVRVRRAGLADLSPVALKQRLAQSGSWLQALFTGRAAPASRFGRSTRRR